MGTGGSLGHLVSFSGEDGHFQAHFLPWSPWFPVLLSLFQCLQGEGLGQSWFLVVHNKVWANGHGGWARGAGSQGETAKAVQSGCCV